MEQQKVSAPRGPSADTIEKQQTIEEVNRLILKRQAKARQLQKDGHNPYRNDFKPTHTTYQIKKKLAKVELPDGGSPNGEPILNELFSIAGRIVEHRIFGKVAFVKLADRTDRLQVYIRKDMVGQEAYAIFKKAEAYDFLGVSGKPFLTKTGELTLMAEEVVLLTKAVRPPPEKWKGLKDKETRYRQRYVDLIANPEVAEVFRKRSEIIKFLRKYFDDIDFIEVETPLLHSILGGAAAKPFCTHHNALNMPLYLRIAPELFLKRLVVGGFERVYEIGRNFRNEGLSRQHNPEFTMLEFYQAYATYQDLMDLTEDLFMQLTKQICNSTQIQYQGQDIDLSPRWPRLTVKECIVQACKKEGFSPEVTLKTLDDAGATEKWCKEAGLLARDDQLGQWLRFAESHGKRLGILFEELGESHLPADRPTFVIDYPAATSPLSRRKDNCPELVDRFELFIAGREIVNAFSELNDPADQRDRFVHQLKERERGDEEAMEYDEDYCRALEYGMPPTAGEGIGIDRLVMLLCDQPSIRDVVLFPHMRPEGR